MRRLPPLGALRAFEAAARHLNFGLAADELGLTPTAISHQVRRLEAYCGKSLFRRHPRPLSLTETGAALFSGVREAFDRLAVSMRLVETHAAPATLRVTTTNAFASRWLVPRLGLWRSSHPDVELFIVGTDRVLSLEGGEADLAIRYARMRPQGAGEAIFRDRYFPVCSPRLREGRPKPSKAADLLDWPLIHYDWRSNERSAPTWEMWFRGASGSRPPRCALSFREETHAIEAAVAGQGVVMCSEIVAADDLAAGRLVKALNRSLGGYGFFPVFAADRASVGVIDAFLRWLTATAKSESG